MQQQLLTFDPNSFKAYHDAATLDEDRIGFRAVIKVLTSWKLSDDEKVMTLGGLSIGMLSQIDLNHKMTIDLRTRVSLILGIYKNLKTMFIQESHRIEWLHSKNKSFCDYSPKDVISSGALIGLYEVRRYLDASLT